MEIEVGATDSNVKDRANVLEYELSFVCAETGKTIVQNGSVQVLCLCCDFFFWEGDLV